MDRRAGDLVIGVMAGFPLADPIVGLLITIAILFVLKGAARDIYRRRLMDAVEPEVLDQAEQVLRAAPGVLAVDSLRMRWIGHRLRGEAEITVATDLTVAQGHLIASEAEQRMVQRVRRLDAITVHVGPTRTTPVQGDLAVTASNG